MPAKLLHMAALNHRTFTPAVRRWTTRREQALPRCYSHAPGRYYFNFNLERAVVLRTIQIAFSLCTVMVYNRVTAPTRGQCDLLAFSKCMHFRPRGNQCLERHPFSRMRLICGSVLPVWLTAVSLIVLVGTSQAAVRST